MLNFSCGFKCWFILDELFTSTRSSAKLHIFSFNEGWNVYASMFHDNWK